jgi:hypothetical protein
MSIFAIPQQAPCDATVVGVDLSRPLAPDEFNLFNRDKRQQVLQVLRGEIPEMARRRQSALVPA